MAIGAHGEVSAKEVVTVVQRCVKVLGASLIIALAFPVSSLAQVTFERTYVGSQWDYGYSVQQTLDGGYVIVGNSSSFGGFQHDVYMIKTDSLGDTLWTRTYGGDETDHGNCVLLISDGGYAIIGSTGGWSGDVYMIRTDSLGDTLWTRTYGGSDADYAFSGEQTSDGGYIIVGFSVGAGVQRAYLVKTDSLGDTLWTRTYGDSASSLLNDGYSVQQTSDGGYILVGHSNRETFPMGLYLIKTDSLGDTLWTRVFGGWNDCGFSVLQTPDGGYVIAGLSYIGGPGNGEVWLLKTDSLGDTLWTRKYGGIYADLGYSLRQTRDGGYVITGWTGSSGARTDVWLLKTDSLGDTLWTRTYGGTDSDFGYSVQQTLDGGYVIVGFGFSFGPHTDIYFIKTDENGLVIAQKDGAVLSIDAPGDTVFSDSSYGVMATVQNLGNVVLTFDVVATIDGYVDTFQVSGLGPGYTREATFKDWLVPPADSATYTMTVCSYVQNDIDSTNDCAQKTIFAYNPLGVEESSTVDVRDLRFRLLQNEPNPFHGGTVIGYSLPVGGAVALEIYDITGGLVKTLVDEHHELGLYQVRWEPKGRANGIYFYRLQAGEFRDTKKMILVRK